MEKVQRNEMPDIETIPNKTHENASKSDLEPIKKPWEHYLFPFPITAES
jgi:hypothetical protein